MEPPYVPTTADLTPIAREAFERVYSEALTRRPRCSREDFGAGYLSALMHYGILSPFTHEARAKISAQL